MWGGNVGEFEIWGSRRGGRSQNDSSLMQKWEEERKGKWGRLLPAKRGERVGKAGVKIQMRTSVKSNRFISIRMSGG